MQRYRKKSLTKWIVLLPVLAIVATFVAMIVIVLSAQKTTYEESVKSARISYIKNSKINAKDRIDKLVEYINFNERFLINQSKEEIKNIVNLAHGLITQVYNQNAHLPKEVIFERIAEKLRDMRFFDDLSGYYFVYEMNGVNVMHAQNPSLEGKNLIDVQDADGKYTIQEAIKALEKEEAAFYTWRWKNPEDQHFRTKVGYIRRFEPLNIYFGSARYEDEIQEKIKKETQTLLLNTVYGETGYIFAHDDNGVCISHGNPKEVGKNRLNVVSGGQYIVRDFIYGSKVMPEGFFINYTSTYRPDGKKDTSKISYIRRIPQFGWSIGTGAYLEEENVALKEYEKLLNYEANKTISLIVSISLVVLILLISFMAIVSRRITFMIERYEGHLLVSNKHIRTQKRIFETLYQKSHDGIWLLKEGIFTDCNESILRLFGAHEKKEMVQITPVDISPEFQPDGESSLEKSLRMNALALENGSHKFEWQAKKSDGTLFWISVVMTSIPMPDGVILHCSIRDISARKELEEENKKQKKLLIHQVEHDVLTGLPNRNLLQDRLSQAIKKSTRDGTILGIVFVDIDKFKTINDTLGHDVGDVLLQTIALRMRNAVRESDTVARLGGDEFILLFDGCNDINDILIAIKKFLGAFKTPVSLGSENFKVTMSMGISVFPNDGKSAMVLLKNADIAMYKAKTEGRNRYIFFDQAMNQETNEHLEIEKSLYRALANEEFELYYQPQINLQTGAIVGLEALIRWNHPTKGLLAPGAFIYVAEESDLITEIGYWVLEKALLQMKAWYKKGFTPGKVAVNVAGRQLDDANFILSVMKKIKKTGAKTQWLELEIVERFIMKDAYKAISLLKRLRELGIDISIDDFGTGHSSLAYLKQLPITKLKIDQSFVQNIEHSREDRAIATTIIELGRGLGLKVLAEGVETEEQKEFIYKGGCELMQGYLFSKPLRADAIEEMLKNENRML